MLLRPPLIHEEDVKSQSSNHQSSIQKQKSIRSTSKNRKKQSTIGLGNKYIQHHQQNNKKNQYEQKQFDNQSVHSVNSKKSKGKTKQSTIALKKRSENSNFLLQNKYTQNQIFKLDSEDDNKSVNSHTSKNSKKNKVKQNSLGKNKLQIKMNYYQQDKNKYKRTEHLFLNNQTIDYSKVQKVQLNQNLNQNSPKVMKYQNQNPFKPQKLSNKNEPVIQKKHQIIQKKHQTIQKKHHSYSPFQEITLNRQEEQQGPVFILKQQESKLKKNNIPSIKVNNIDKPQQANQKILFQNQQKCQLIQIQQQKNCLNQTKSISKTRRNKIFQNGNNSKSNIDSCELNLSSNFQKSRSKSKSKLGGLLKQNRQKKFNQSKVQNFSNLYSNHSEIDKKQLVKLSNLQESKQFQKNQINGKIIKISPIQRKQETHFLKFDLGLSQSDLNLSNSLKKQNFGLQQKQKDSVHFNFQRQRDHHKKGLSITSKEKKDHQYQQIHGSLQSKKQSHIERLKKKQQQSQDILNSILLKPQFNQQSRYRQCKQRQTIQAKGRSGIELVKPQKNKIKIPQCQNNITSQKLLNKNPNQIKLKNTQEYKIPIDCELLTRELPQQQKYSIKQVKREQFIVSKSLTKHLNQNKSTNEDNIKNKKGFQNFCQKQKYNQTSEKDAKIDNKHLRQQKFAQIVLERLPSIQTQQISQSRSQRSNSQQKKSQKKVKQNSLNKGKKHNVQIRNQSPRGEQSFYESDKQETKHQITKQVQNKNNKFIENNNHITKTKQQQFKQKVQNKKPAKLINFDSQEQIQNFKSKTDSNFYQYCQQSQKSLKPPSSKPPLSKRSNASSSNSKSKPKQSTIKINKQNSLKLNLNKGQQQIKKKSLVQLALQKNYEGSNYSRSNSQQSFNSRQSGDYSTESKKSKSSKKSFKKESTLPITIKSKNNTFTSGLGKPPIKKIYTDSNSQIQIFDSKNSYISDKLSSDRQQKEERQKNYQMQNINQRKIISKDTYFIDQNGKLVKKDLVIQGNKAYGMSNSQQQAEQLIKSRMKRSRQRHNSRSKSRQKSQSRLNKKSSSSTSYEEQVYQSNYSNIMSKQNESNQFYSNSYFQNFSTKNQYQCGKKYNLPPKTLQQFLKPLEQKPLYKFQKNANKKIQSQFYQNQQKFEYQQSYVQKTTLNQLFGKNEDVSKQPGRKKSLHRTEKQTNKKG